MVAEMVLTINALPQGFVLSDTLLEVALGKTVRFVDVFWFVSHYTTDRAAKRGWVYMTGMYHRCKCRCMYVLASDHDRVDEGEPAMGMLQVISKRGDDRVQWNEQDAQAGDAEANAAIREAERIFAQERAKGATAFRVEPGKQAERIEQFDQEADQIILVPRVVGG
jgi:hypothetical protein